MTYLGIDQLTSGAMSLFDVQPHTMTAATPRVVGVAIVRARASH